MSQRANPAIIGAFVVGAAALLVAALVVWGGTAFLHTKLPFVMYFDSAVTGLNKGAPVMFRGVRIGEVTDVQVRWGTPLVAVYVALDPDTLKGAPRGEVRKQIDEVVQKGLRAQLRTQSLLTGVLFVALDAVPNAPLVLHGLDPSTPELPTIPTNVEVWLSKLEQIADKIAGLPLEQIATAVTTALDETTRRLRSPEITRALKNTESLVSDARAVVGKLGALTATVTAQVDPLASDGRATMQSAQATLRSAQAALAGVPPLVDDVRRVVEKVDAQVDPLLVSLRKSSDVAQGTLEQARTTLQGVNGVLDQDSSLGFELMQVLRELRETARSLRTLADYLERMPDSVVYGVRRGSPER